MSIEEQREPGKEDQAEGEKDAAAQPESLISAEAGPIEATVEKIEMVADEVAPEQIEEEETEAETEERQSIRAAYEHPLAIRITHWVNAISLFVMITSGWRIFRAFPSFGPKIPEKVLLDIPRSLTLGGWLGGALQWHFTFMWFFAGSGIFYVAYQLISGHYRTLLFTARAIPGVWPMVRYYFFFGPKPPATGQYNSLQKLAYTSTIGLGALSLLTGIVLYEPIQFSWLAFLFGGFHLTRIWHFAAMCGFVAFIPGHLIMVAAHGWRNFYSMLVGWKRDPEYQE
jgi:Ni/Fe-hydrogenase b-type cytochrome subunit